MNYEIGENYLRSLEKKATNGDLESINELKAINRRFSKVSNSRLAYLEKSGYDYYAYDRATFYTSNTIGKDRFSSATVGKDASEIVDNIREMRTFLTAKSSTITGQKQIEKKRLDWVSSLGLDIPKRSQKAFLRFLGSESATGMMQDIGGSPETMALIIEARKGNRGKGMSFENIGNVFNRYQQGKILYDELFDELGIDMASVNATKKVIVQNMIDRRG